jgi:hypothetical protein
MKLVNAILKYHLLSFTRLKMSTFRAPPDYIAIVLSIGFISGLIVAISSENPIIINQEKILNFNYIAIFFYVASFFFEGYILDYYAPNYQYVKLIFPVKLSKLIFIDFLGEIFSYKIIFIIFFILAFVALSNNYKIELWNSFNIVGIFLIILSYVNSCLLVQVIKNKMRSIAFSFHKNFFKLLFFTLLIITTLNKNLKLIKFDELNTLYWFLVFSLLLTVTFVFIIFRINMKKDRI